MPSFVSTKSSGRSAINASWDSLTSAHGCACLVWAHARSVGDHSVCPNLVCTGALASPAMTFNLVLMYTNKKYDCRRFMSSHPSPIMVGILWPTREKLEGNSNLVWLAASLSVVVFLVEHMLSHCAAREHQLAPPPPSQTDFDPR